MRAKGDVAKEADQNVDGRADPRGRLDLLVHAVQRDAGHRFGHFEELHLAGEGHTEDGQALQQARGLPPGDMVLPVAGQEGLLGLANHLEDEAEVKSDRGGTDRTEAVDILQQAEGEDDQCSHEDEHPQSQVIAVCNIEDLADHLWT